MISYALVEAIIDIYASRPVVTKDPHTGKLYILVPISRSGRDADVTPADVGHPPATITSLPSQGAVCGIQKGSHAHRPRDPTGSSNKPKWDDVTRTGTTPRGHPFVVLRSPVVRCAAS